MREGDYFINFRAWSDNEYLDINIYELNEDYRLLKHIKAPQATALDAEKKLALQDAEIFVFGKEGRIEQQYAKRLAIPFTILELTDTMPDSLAHQHMNLYQLYSYINFLARNDLNSDAYELALWTRFSAVLSILVVILLAFPWIFASVQSATMGRRFFIGVLLGLSYVIASRIFGNLSIGYNLPLWLGAFSPVILFSLLGFYLLRVIR